MRRVSVVGTAGSGKTTVGLRIAAVVGVPFLEIDGLFWQPGWASLDRADLRHAVEEWTGAHDAWVVDGNYSGSVQDVVWSRADTVVWLDLSKATVMLQVIARTLGRVVLRRKLWNGNRERWRNLMTLNQAESVIAWSWHQHGRKRQQYEADITDSRWQHLTFVRLRSRREVTRFLRDLQRTAPRKPDVGRDHG